ncbi:MAG: ZIP family metal transporter [Desulfurococcales archaeon]|nr:ZIP family metal transporter [Desulfurococcales archaeon]
MASALVDAIVSASGGDPVRLALIMSSIAMVLTTLGGFGAVMVRGSLGTRRFSMVIDLGLGFSSGVMIVASFTSLLLPAIDSYGVVKPILGLAIGALAIHVVNKSIPHEHFVKGYEGPSAGLGKLRAAWLVAFAIIIHNFPEGLSIGAASAYSGISGVTLGLAIAIQDIPEGLAVSIPVYASTGSLGKGLFYAWLSGFSEVLLALPAAALSQYSVILLPYMMGFGAGAMIYVVSHEALPETHRSGHEGKATLAFFAGFIIMIILDTVLG